MRLRCVLVLALLALLPDIVHGQMSVRELHADYVDFTSRVAIASVETSFYTQGPLGPTEGIEKQRDQLLERLEADPELERQFRTEFKRSVGTDLPEGFSAIRECVYRRFAEDLGVANNATRKEERYQFLNGKIPQIIFRGEADGAAKDSVHRVLQYGLKHSLIKDDVSRWTERDLYNSVTPNLISRMATINLDGICPPGFEHPSLNSKFDTGLGLLWRSHQDVVSLGIAKQNGMAMHVVGRTLGGRGCLLAGFQVNDGSGLPPWVCFCQSAAEIDLFRPQLSAFLGYIDSIKKGSSFECSDPRICPNRVTFFDERKEIEGFGEYAFTLLQFEVRRGTGGGLWNEAPIRNFLKISDFKLGTSVPAVEPIVIAKGASYLDRDTNVGRIVGQKPGFELKDGVWTQRVGK